MQVSATPAAANQVSLIPALNDNYIFVLHGQGLPQAAVVDPAVAAPVIAWLEQRDLQLAAILHTHHHHDHIGGSAELLQRWPQAAVIASGADRERIPLQTRSVSGGDQLKLLGRTLQVLAVPGHTAHHIAYYLPPLAGDAASGGELFCGDTLFAAGCGRLFEGTAAQMHHSLQQLAGLPPSTRVWCAHEYTEGNLRWAAREEPDDAAIAQRLERVRQLRQRGAATIPSSVAEERATNLFVRARDAQELQRRRDSKDRFRG